MHIDPNKINLDERYGYLCKLKTDEGNTIEAYYTGRADSFNGDVYYGFVTTDPATLAKVNAEMMGDGPLGKEVQIAIKSLDGVEFVNSVVEGFYVNDGLRHIDLQMLAVAIKAALQAMPPYDVKVSLANRGLVVSVLYNYPSPLGRILTINYLRRQGLWKHIQYLYIGDDHIRQGDDDSLRGLMF